VVSQGSLLGGRYRLITRLGKGGMGEVWEAMQEGLGRRVAVKVLLPELLQEPELLTRLQREAQSAASLGHPNIVAVTDFVSSPGEPPFLVMDLLVGRPLSRAIEEGPMSEARVAFIASQVLDALAAAHRAGIIHRDIKPDNIFLTSIAGVDDIVKVLDFGIAKLYGETEAPKLTMTGAVLGTPQFMAPEQARGRSVDARTDVHAVGTCMYLALTGRLPFSGDSFNALLFAIAEEPAPPVTTVRSSVDPRFAAIVERAMAKDPNARFPSAEEMRAALTPFLRAATSPAATLPSSLPVEAVQQKEKKSNVGWIVALLVVLAIGGTVGGLFAAGVFDEDAPAQTAKMKQKQKSAPEESEDPKKKPAADEEGEAAEEPAPSTPSTAPVKKADAPAKPKPSVAASASGTPGKETGGKSAYLSTISTNGLYTTDAVRKVATPHGAAVNACYAHLQFDPVDHQFVNWKLTVDAGGNVTDVGPMGSAPRSAALDSCMTKVFKSMVFGAPTPGKTGPIVIGYTSRAPWNP
jgi:serine/threonine protein kinase